MVRHVRMRRKDEPKKIRTEFMDGTEPKGKF
jgi:hypothetical protein